MSSKQTNSATAANSARAEYIPSAKARPQTGDRGSAMRPRILQLLQARRLSFSLTLLAICLLLGTARPAHAQAQAVGKNSVSTQLHIQVYLVPVTMAQLQATQLKPQLATEPVSYNITTNTNLRIETQVTTAPMPPAIVPSDRSAVVETTTVVPR
jgi:hypothetical protein